MHARNAHGLHRVGGCFALAILFLSASCGGKTFNVKVQPKADPAHVGSAATSNGLTARAEAEWDEDWLMENFDANLVLAYVLAVRVVIENRGAEPIRTKKLDLELLDGEQHRFKYLKPKKAMKAIEGYYGVTIQSKTGRKLYQQDFLANALDLETPLAPGESRQGFVFFDLPKDANQQHPLTLRLHSKSDKIDLTTPAN